MQKVHSARHERRRTFTTPVPRSNLLPSISIVLEIWSRRNEAIRRRKGAHPHRNWIASTAADKVRNVWNSNSSRIHGEPLPCDNSIGDVDCKQKLPSWPEFFLQFYRFRDFEPETVDITPSACFLTSQGVPCGTQVFQKKTASINW